VSLIPLLVAFSFFPCSVPVFVGIPVAELKVAGFFRKRVAFDEFLLCIILTTLFRHQSLLFPLRVGLFFPDTAA